MFVATGLVSLSATAAPGFGPSLSDALPLDELPRHDSVSFWLFAIVWIVVAWAAHTLTPRRADRLWLSTLAVWLASLAATAASVAVVRQVALTGALAAALSTAAVYLAAVLFAAGSLWAGRLGPAAHA